MAKVWIEDSCIGCEACVDELPDVFQMGDNGKAKVVNPEGASLEEIKEVAEACPTESIKVEE